jgi:aminoglycoside phosphotransferase (APT) family kinase protein
MGREFRVLSRLNDVFPYCPRPLAYCDDPAVLGEPFYLMERIEGIVLRRDPPDGLSLDSSAARSLCRNLIDVHLELHGIDVDAVGLGDLGKPQGYVSRQVDGWSHRYRNARTEDVPDNETLMTWLAEHQPSDTERGTIIHNDYKFDNVVLRPQDLRIIGVLDWEMATLGDPLMDLGCSLAYWIQADDPQEMQQLRMMPTQLPGMMTRRELVDYYSDRSGTAAGDFHFYYAFGLFRLAVIVQQIYFRFVRGQTRDKRFAGFGQMCSMLSRTALAATRGERSL